MEEKLNELLQKAGDAWEQKDYVTALDAYRQAADLGSADAAYNVSVMSMNELGTERDLETAMVYAVKAKQGGSEDAGELIDLLRQNASLLGERAYQAGDGENAVKYYRVAALSGMDSEACYRLAVFYVHGWGGLKQDLGKALEYALEAEQEKHPDAGKLVERIGGIACKTAGLALNAGDAIRAEELYHLAVLGRSPEGCLALGQMYAGAQGVTQNRYEAQKLFYRAWTLGSEEAQDELEISGSAEEYTPAAMFRFEKESDIAMRLYIEAVRHAAGIDDVRRDLDLAELYARQAYAMGDPEARDLVIEIRKNRFDRWVGEKMVPRCEALKDELASPLKTADPEPDGQAEYERGKEWMKAEHYDPARSFSWFRQAAMKDHPDAMYELGVMYSRGLGTERNSAEAMNWFEKSARRGNLEAALLLAGIYAHENGSFEDRKKAARWCSLTGNHYLHGSGTPQDTAEAIRWYKLAEEMGGEDSAMKLAVIYHYGIGTDRDLAEARRWYEKAAKNGDSAAAYALSLPEFRDLEADNG